MMSYIKKNGTLMKVSGEIGYIELDGLPGVLFKTDGCVEGLKSGDRVEVELITPALLKTWSVKKLSE